MKSGYQYQILVSPKAGNQIGLPVRTTITMDPPNQSNNVRSLSKGDSWIVLTWDQPIDHVEKFHIFIAKENEPEISMRRETIDPAYNEELEIYNTSFNVTDLDPSANYLISVVPSSGGLQRELGTTEPNNIHTCKCIIFHIFS